MRRALALCASLALSAAAASTSSSCTFLPPSPPALDAVVFLAWLQSHAPVCPTLVLAPGAYDLAPPPPGSPAHLVLEGLSNVTVLLAGVTLTLGARNATALYATQLSNVTLAGPVDLLYAELPTNQAAITAIAGDGRSFDVHVPVGYPLSDWARNASFGCNVFDPATRRIRPGTWDLYFTGLTPVGGGEGGRAFVMTFGQDMGPQKQNVGTGDLLGCRAAEFAFTVRIDGCENSTFADVHLLGGPGFGFFSSGRNVPGSRGNNTFLRPHILRPPPPVGASEAPLMSLSADGFHSAGVPWGPHIDGAYFEGFGDDGVAIHGAYDVVVQAVQTGGSGSSDGQLWLTAVGAYEVGDVLRVYNASFSPAVECSITAVADAARGFTPPANVSKTMPSRGIGPGTRFLLLNVSLSGGGAWGGHGLGFDCVASNSNAAGDGFTVRNSFIGFHRARGMLIKASDGVIENNTVANSTMAGIVITPELYWGEADYVRNLIVRNNTILGVGAGKQGYGGIALGAFTPSGSPAPRGHINVSIIGNVLVEVGYAPIWVDAVDGLVLANNTVVSPFPVTPPWASCCENIPLGVVVWATQARGVSVSGNCVYAPGASTAGVFNVTSTVEGTGLVDGVRLC